ncbi:hypothetical protein NA57DRAFT_80012 [Rhizodiscina lignyota]|uniref:Transmembrane protein 19 n=1 Tax=Rhizodiscina lignyota TaxID=1504668 RepID=A0A9P4M2P2_9PEZI|nr:hypothetical protein NA57DRAFT_80012 [Rhizodiscina lignyota]
MKPIIAVPAILAIVYRAWSRNSLTPLGLFVATLTAVGHAIHPWSFSFTLLGVFFLAGTRVTKVKHDIKVRLTQSASGASGGEGPRTHVQVLANSLVALILTVLHAWVLSKRDVAQSQEDCWHRPSAKYPEDVLVVGIVANYVAVAADTFSSELGILASSSPRLITAPWRTVPRGTNGGVTLTGIIAGLAGSGLLAATAGLLLPFCAGTGATKRKIPGFGHIDEYSWDWQGKLGFVLAMTAVGLGGSLLDSIMGALVQASVVDVRTGKVVEGDGGNRVQLHSRKSWQVDGPASNTTGAKASLGQAQRRKGVESSGTEEKGESRRLEVGWDLLDNNGVNFAMAFAMSAAAMVGACIVWEIPLGAVVDSILN